MVLKDLFKYPLFFLSQFTLNTVHIHTGFPIAHVWISYTNIAHHFTEGARAPPISQLVPPSYIYVCIKLPQSKHLFTLCKNVLITETCSPHFSHGACSSHCLLHSGAASGTFCGRGEIWSLIVSELIISCSCFAT